MSLFKRLFRDRDDSNNNPVPIFKPQHATIKALGSNLQKRFSRGVQYNMKILIRGDRNVGKSALLNRLKGQDFVDQYMPTEEIEVACIQWTYKCTEDVVKVEVWDVVDKGRKKVVSGLKMDNSSAIEEAPTPMCLDAEFLDVYKGAHGVIIVLDMTKSWTYNYVERELSKLPEDLPVLVLANHRDMGHHRTISADQVITLIEPLPGYKKGLIKYWESSMKNGYGLVYIHRFFNIPFLMLQRDTLLKQLATNDNEMRSTLVDMEEFEESSEASYETFIKSLKSARAASPPHKPSSLALHSNPTSQINSPSSPSSHTNPTHKGSMTPVTDGCIRPPIHPPQARPIPGMEKLGLYPLPVPNDNETPLTENAIKPDGVTLPLSVSTTSDIIVPQKKEIFDFVPDEHPELSTFFDDPMSPRSIDNNNPAIDSSSDEDDHVSLDDTNPRKSKRSNPMVAVFQDDIDEEDNDTRVSALYNGVNNHSDPTSSDDQNDSYALPIIASSSTRSSNGTITNGKLVVRSVSEVSSIATVTEDSVVTPYSEIVFDASELDVLEQMSSKKEIDIDQITVNSTSSTKHKKKSKKHHKQSEAKDSSAKKKKKKSSRKSDEDTVHELDSTTNNKYSKRHSRTVIDHCSGDPVIKCESSDSLEKFLNE